MCSMASNLSMHRPASSQARGGTGAMALQEKVRPSTASDRTRLVQHFGPDAEDVEHMSERYIDEQLPGAVQLHRCEDPRPRLQPPPPPPVCCSQLMLLTCLLCLQLMGFVTCTYS